MNKKAWFAACVLFSVFVLAMASVPQPAEAKDPIKIAFISGFTGPYGSINKKNLQGITIAVEEINKNGGIMGRPIELIEKDDKADPKLAVNIAQKLILKERVDVVIGPTLTATCVATTPLFTEAEMVQLISGTGVPVNANEFPYVFRVAFGTREQAEAIVNYAVDQLDATKIGLIGDSTALGRNGAKDVMAAMEKRDLEPVAEEYFNPGDMNLTAQLKRLKDAGSQALVLYAIGPDAANVLKARKDMGWDVPVIGHIALALKGVYDLIGEELSQGVYSVMDRNFTVEKKGDKPIPKVAGFREKVVERYGEIDDTLFLFAVFYDPVYVYKYAVEKTQSTDSNKIKAALESMEGLDLLQGTVRFEPDYHNGIWPEDMTVVKIDSLHDGLHVRAPHAP